jgi:hypothetical protein
MSYGLNMEAESRRGSGFGLLLEAMGGGVCSNEAVFECPSLNSKTSLRDTRKLPLAPCGLTLTAVNFPALTNL